jgi:hypothetical protein
MERQRGNRLACSTYAHTKTSATSKQRPYHPLARGQKIDEQIEDAEHEVGFLPQQTLQSAMR